MAALLPARFSTPVANSVQRKRIPQPVRRVALRVHAQAQSKPVVAQFFDSIGLPTDEGIFGFKPFAEVWTGRLAMIGFLSSVINEFATGRGTLQQLGIYTPSQEVFFALCALAGGATLVGTLATAQKLYTRKLSRNDIARYKNFLGLNKEDDYKAEAAAMKARGDFTTPGNDMQAIAEAKAQGAPVDQFLSTNDIAEADAASREMKAKGGLLTLTKQQEQAEVMAAEQQMKAREQQAQAGPSSAAAAAAPKSVEDQVFFNDELKYARDVELTNGRYAMLGFLAAIIVEALTGNGIIGQGIMYLKLSGILGAKSGF